MLSAQNATNPVSSRNAVDAADTRLNEAIALDARFDQAILLLADLKIRKGIPAAAVDLLAPLVKERPQIAQAHYLLASAYLALQKRNDALAVYRQMTELFPKDPQPPFLVGSILLAQGQQSDARKAFERSTLPKSSMPPHWRERRSRSIRTRSWRKRGPLEARFILHSRISRTLRQTC